LKRKWIQTREEGRYINMDYVVTVGRDDDAMWFATMADDVDAAVYISGGPGSPYYYDDQDIFV